MKQLIATIALVFVVLTAGANAQQTPAHIPANPVLVPTEYMGLFYAYRAWKPANESVSEVHAYSLGNWATHALNEVERTGIVAIRNWLFTRGEERIRQLAMEHKGELLVMFGAQFNLRGMHIVFAQTYTSDTNALYRAWYECAAKLKWWPEQTDSNELVGEYVLAGVNSWNDSTFERLSSRGDCKSDFSALAAHYGVETLSADDLTAIGFLSRRFAANRLNPRFASAEFLRQLVHDIFDPDEQ